MTQLETPERCLQFLKSDSYIEFMRQSDDGAIGNTHMASVNWGDEAADSWVKIYKKDAPRSLINEMIGYVLANALKLPQPKHAALMPMYLDKLDVKVAEQLSDIDIYRGYTYAWVTTHAGENKRQLVTNNSPVLELFLEELANWTMLESMIAFDYWLVNNDRHIGNLLQLPDTTFTLIDHGETCGGREWNIDTFQKLYLSARASHLDTLQRRYRKQDLFTPIEILSNLTHAKESHQKALETAEPELLHWLEAMIGDEYARLPIEGMPPLRMLDVLIQFLHDAAKNNQRFEQTCAALLRIYDENSSEQRPS